MRKSSKDQLPLNPVWPAHEMAKELRMTSRILDANPEIPQRIMKDLSDGAKKKPASAKKGRGASGMSAEQVLRCAIIKNSHSFSYSKLAFHLADSCSFRVFSRIPYSWSPSKACLQENISRIKTETLQDVNQDLVRWAAGEKLEAGRKVRGDSTTVASPVPYPNDSALLYDGVRVLTRLLKELSREAPLHCSDHCRRARRRSIGISRAQGEKKRKKLYKDLLKVSHRTLGYAEAALQQVPCNEGTAFALGQLQHYAELTARVIDQTERRVLREEKVAARDKLYSIFEEHTDIIRKGQREDAFGHKVFLTTGKSSLILDCRVERGNPTDESQFKPMLERVEQILGRMPSQVTFDGGFSSNPNLDWAKVDKEIRDVAFPPKGRMKLSEMVRSSWVYKQLKKFRNGIEGCISMLKRVFGADRCTWKGWDHFCQYVQLSVVSFNLLVLSRMKLAAEG